MNNKKDQIYESITKKQILFLFCISGAIGFIMYAVCFGISFLNVTNDSWLLQGGDLMQHYVGWKAYRASEWHFPIGMTDGLLYPAQTCIIFTDSIPLFAIFFKFLSPILPETFQYFGIWGAMTFILMGGISAIIFRKFTENLWYCISGSLFFSFSPYVIQRIYGHTALAGNWIILLAIAIWIYKPFFHNFKRKTIAWTCLLVIGSLVHIYYIPMIMVFMIFSCFQDLLENKGWAMDLVMGGIAIVTDLAVLYRVGAFSVTSSMEAGGLGEYSSNLNTFFNQLGRGRFLPRLPQNPGQDEGYGYLGLGILILLGIACIVLIVDFSRRLIKKEIHFHKNQNFFTLIKDYSFLISMVLAWIVLFILAISPVITYNTKTILEISYPSKVTEILSIFRASGRFIWCNCYILMFFAVTICIKKIPWMPVALGTILVAACIQIADLKDFAMAKGALLLANSRENVIVSDRWEELAEGKKHLTYLPFSIIKTSYDDDTVYEFANFAVDHGMTVNYYTAARVDIPALEAQDWQVRLSLSDGERSTEILYVLDGPETGENFGMTVENIDGIFVGYFR